MKVMLLIVVQYLAPNRSLLNTEIRFWLSTIRRLLFVVMPLWRPS